MKLPSRIKILPVLMLAAAAWSCGAQAQAAQITLSTSPSAPAAGEWFDISVRLSTQDDALNAAEGSVSLGTLDVKSVSTGGSAMSLWPVEPHYSLGSRSIEFAGGVPGSIAAGEDVLLFVIKAKAPAAGTYSVSAGSARAFKSDGRGTPVAIAATSKKIAVSSVSSGTAAPESKDASAPQFVSVEIGQDPSLFDGRKYLTFFATDDQSGVDRYQVKEGWFGSYRDADRYYVLADQEQGTALWVRATDAAGNTATKKVPTAHPLGAWKVAAGGILILLALAVMYRSYRKRRHF